MFDHLSAILKKLIELSSSQFHADAKV